MIAVMTAFRGFLFALLLACAAAPALAAPVVSAPASLKQGDPLLAWVTDAAVIEGGRAELHGPSGALLDSCALFARKNGAGTGQVYGALFAVPMDAKPGAYGIVITGAEAAGPNGPSTTIPFRLSLSFGVEARVFHTENIPLDAANTELLARPDPLKDAEARALYSLLGRVDADAVYLDAGFLVPVEGYRETAGFGDRRRYLFANGGSETSVHAGIDLAVPQKTPVHACAAGRVVFTGERIVTGNTAVVEHLPGLYSIYMHMAEIRVAVGQVLARGDLVGLSGSTGLSTGPHLHWELRLRGVAVDPEYWLSAQP